MKYSNIYFLGIGGIGMSALARYFLHGHKCVGGYDRTATELTDALEREGASVNFDDSAEAIAKEFRDPASTLVVYTPAIPQDNAQMRWFAQNGFVMEKRSEMLGHIAAGKYVMAVAGTHGKTTTTTLLAWLNSQAARGGADPITGHEGRGGNGGGSAFLGGISGNFNSNLVLGEGERLAVEADEFDRSFLRLHPDVALITSIDADHLDIYGTYEAVKEAFAQFIRQVKKGGAVVIKKGIEAERDNPDVDYYTYSLDEPCDFYAKNVTLLEGGLYNFDIMCPDRVIEDCTLGIPGRVNVENTVAAVAMMWVAGFDEHRLRRALKEFRGVKRRFELYINTPRMVYMDDYAHHPRELSAAITSVKKMFPGRNVLAVFQPHLYTRTRDFYREFAEALSLADSVLLLPIYPARELPIEGVEAGMIADRITVPHSIVQKDDLAEVLRGMDTDVVVTFGAGDIDRCCGSVADLLRDKMKNSEAGQ